MRFPFVLLTLPLVYGISPVVLRAQQPAKQPAPAKLEAAKPEAAKPAALSKTAAPANKADDQALAAIRQGSRAFEAAFAQGDAAAIAAMWTEDGDYIDEDGQVFAGREAIQQAYAEFAAENKGTRIRLVIDSLRLLSPEAAIEDGRAILDPAPRGAPAASKYTAVHVKVNGKWLISTLRDQRVEAPSGYRNIADLEWLIGEWSAESNGGKMESVCRWVANKSFVERTYTSSHSNGETSSGVQMIGFNPQTGEIQSWNFSSDGGVATGVWTPRENGWMAEMQGALGDGTPTTAINLLTRLDNKAYVWQSIRRTAGDVSLPDTDEVLLKRKRDQ